MGSHCRAPSQVFQGLCSEMESTDPLTAVKGLISTSPSMALSIVPKIKGLGTP